MTATEQQVKISAQLYDMRDKARRLLGDKYKERMVLLGAMVTDIARQEGKSELGAAIDVCKQRHYVGMDLWLVMAAAVELTEPTP